MAQKFLTDIELTRGLKDSSGDLGNSGQVLSSTGSALNWINANSAASVVYQDGFTGDGSTTAFTLANSIDNENKTQVYIDGVYQHKDTYSLSGTTLTFSTAPPNSSDIEVISFSSVSSADDILYDTDFTSAGLMTTNGSGTYSITTNNSSNWNTAYTYSQVGHLPLAGGTISGNLIATSGQILPNELSMGDNKKILIGNGDDLKIYHDGSNSYIQDTATGNLLITSNGASVQINKGTTENMAEFIVDGGVKLYYDSALKLETLTDGFKNYGTFYLENKITHTGDGDTWMSFETDVISFRTGGTDRLVLNNTTATITNDLHVGGTSAARFKSDGTNTYVDAIPGSSSIIFRNSGAVEKARIDGSGNLGIGVTSPTQKLDVVGSGGDTNIRVYDSSANSEVGIKLQGDAKTWTLQNWGSGGDNLRLLNNAGNIVQLWDDNGNVMIGNANDPSYKLQVNVTGNGETALAFMNSAVTADGNGSTNIRFVSASNAQWASASYSAYDHIWYGNGTERMRVHGSTGRVSIGSTTASANTLTLSGTGTEIDIENTSSNGKRYRIASTSSGVLEFIDKTANVERMRIHSDGKIGIGVVPTNNFHVGGVSNYNGIQITGAGASRPSLKFSNINQGQLAQIYGTEGNALVIATGTNSNTAITVDSNQNTTFSGNIAVSVMQSNTLNNLPNSHNIIYRTGTTTVIGGGSSANKLYVLDNGDVGINVTSPNVKLDVDGNATIRGGTLNLSDGSQYDSIINSGSSLTLNFDSDNNSTGEVFRINNNTTSVNANNLFNVQESGTVEIPGAYLFLGTANANNGTTYLTLRNYDSTLVDAGDVQNMIRMTGRYWSGAASQLVETRITSIKQISNGNGGSALGFMTQTGGSSPVEHMRIDRDGKVGINTTSPYGRLDVHGALTVGPANEDPDVSLSEVGDDVSLNNGGGSIEINMPIQGTTTSGCTLVFKYAAASWKSWILDYEFASTSGMVKGVVGGYNNGSTGHSKTKMLEGFSTSVAVAAVGSGNQHVQVTFTFSSGMGIHPFARFKYSQGGGDGTPRADRVSVVYTEGS